MFLLSAITCNNPEKISEDQNRYLIFFQRFLKEFAKIFHNDFHAEVLTASCAWQSTSNQLVQTRCCWSKTVSFGQRKWKSWNWKWKCEDYYYSSYMQEAARLSLSRSRGVKLGSGVKYGIWSVKNNNDCNTVRHMKDPVKTTLSRNSAQHYKPHYIRALSSLCFKLLPYKYNSHFISIYEGFFSLGSIRHYFFLLGIWYILNIMIDKKTILSTWFATKRKELFC